MNNCLIMILFLCVSMSAEEVGDSLQVAGDSIKILTPNPNRIAEERIRVLRSFSVSENNEPEKNISFSLTLEDAVEKLITRNKDVQKAKIGYLVGEKRFHAAFGVFEPYFTGSYEYSESGRQDALLTELRESFFGGIEGVLPTATKYNLSISQKDVRFFQNNNDWPMVSSYASIIQPLLKDFWGNGPVSDIKIAKAERQIAYNRYRSTLMVQCFNLEQLYWKLVYLQEKRRNAEKSVEIARQIVNDSRTLIASGIISELDVIEVNSQFAQRQTELSNVSMEHFEAMKEIMEMVGYSPDSSLLTLKATDPLQVFPEEQLPESLSLEATDSILSIYQPEMLSAEYSRIKSKTSVSQLTGKALPELNVKGVLGVFGANRDINYAVEQFYNKDQNKHNWSWVLELKIPLGAGIRDRNLLKAEKLNHMSIEMEEKTLRNQLISYSRVTLEKLNKLQHNLSNASIVIGYRKSLLQSEMIKLRTGLSNVRKIFEMEQELSNAQESELELQSEYHIAISMYYRLLGLTLSKKGLERIVDGKPVLAARLIELSNLQE